MTHENERAQPAATSTTPAQGAGVALAGLMSRVDLRKPYDPHQVEQPLYQWWEAAGLLIPDEHAPLSPFTISIPPPNVTGELHLGHAMYVIQDVMIRWRRMQGYKTLWLPGTDHAGIATQLQVEKKLRSEGTSRQELGREAFLEETWKWTRKYGGTIQQQLRRLGASCDWNRERFTLDEGLSRAVHTAFKRLYDDGLIYRGTYLVNWSPNLGTAVSDLEVDYETRQGTLWYVRYPLVDEQASLPADTWGSGSWAASASEYIAVATTRPETILGDTAVAVNPDDERYTHLIGRNVLLPAVGRIIPIIADAYVESEFGTGAVKITPAHDPNDYEVGQRHHLPMINIMNLDVSLNDEAGPYTGMDRFVARKALLEDLKREGLLVKEEPHTLNVAISQRGGEVIEPMLSEQWFVHMRPLADMAQAAVQEGRTRIIPEHFEKVYTHWMENIRDWCISRQLWWGHRIPVWYTPDGQVIVPDPDDPPPANATQDPDVLDTWFSSGLWPFSTLGWPDDTEDMRTFYPTSVMETGYDILFFWVARMMMMGCYLTGQEPFHTVYLHGLVRDEHGRKMSKTANNVINPLEIMDQYGTDALRFTLTTSGSPGQDLNLNPQRIEASRNFANKVWNITRFVVGAPERASVSIARIAQLAGETEPHPFPPRSQALAHHPAATLSDRWILSRYGKLVTEGDRLLEGYNFGEAGRQIEDFLWSAFADWYVEAAKVQLEADEPQRTLTCGVLFTVLEGSLRLLHPFMPFLTETAWQILRQAAPADGTVPERKLQHDEPMTTPPPQADLSVQSRSSIMIAVYPTVDSVIRDEAAERLFGLLQELITGIRNVRNEYKVEATRWIAATMIAGPHTAMLLEQAALISTLARVDAEHLTIVSERNETVAADLAQQSATLVVGSVEVLLPLAGLIDLKVEHTRLQKELQEAEAEVSRREARLANADFVNKAPPAVVQRERDNLVTVQATVERLRERLANLLTMMKDA